MEDGEHDPRETLLIAFMRNAAEICAMGDDDLETSLDEIQTVVELIGTRVMLLKTSVQKRLDMEKQDANN